MSTELALPNTESNLSRDFTDFDELGNNSGFPWTSVVAQNGKAVTTHQVFPGEWLLFTTKEKPEKLGKTFDAIVLTYRFKALCYKNKAFDCCSYDFKSELFKQLQQKADVGKFGDDPSYQWGVELLLWNPNACNGAGIFTTYYASSKSARKAVKDKLKPFLSRKNELTGVIEEAPASITFGSFLKVDRHSYIIPTFEQNAGVLRSPDPDALKEALSKFLNPPKSDKEVATAPARDR